MSANYWESSQRNHWLLDRQRVQASKIEDLKYLSQDHLGHVNIWFCNLIHRLGKRLHLRQQVIATALVYFKRFYSKNSFNGTDPNLVLATCLYVACKIEECPQHIKTIVQEMKSITQAMTTMPTATQALPSTSITAQSLASLGGFPYDNSKVAEMEFYLLEELDFYLIVYHPYRSFRKYAKQMKLEETTLQMAWFVINDTYRADLCLLYPPHLIALAAIYMTCVLNADHQAIPISDAAVSDGLNDPDYIEMIMNASPNAAVNNSSNQGAAPTTPFSTPQTSVAVPSTAVTSTVSASLTTHNASRTPATNSIPASLPQCMTQHSVMISFFSGLNVPIESIIEITQEMLSLYELWSTFQESYIPFLLRKLGCGPLYSVAAVSNTKDTKHGGAVDFAGLDLGLSSTESEVISKVCRS